MQYTQTNTKIGAMGAMAGATLTDKEGYLVTLDGSRSTFGGVYYPDVVLASSTSTKLYVLVAGAATGYPVEIKPLTANENVRIKLYGSCTVGDALVAYSTTDGRVQTAASGATGDTLVGWAEETGVTGQFVLVRPFIGLYGTTDATTNAGTKAAAGTTQGTATVLTKPITYVTNATGMSACGVVLPTATAGLDYYVQNASTYPLAVYPFLAQYINNLAVNIPMWVPAGGATRFVSPRTAYWAASPTDIKDTLALAAGGTTYSDASAIVHQVSLATGTVGQGVVLPVAVPGMHYTVYNGSAVELVLYPDAGHTLNNLAANIGIRIPRYFTADCTAISTTNWAVIAQGSGLQNPQRSLLPGVLVAVGTTSADAGVVATTVVNGSTAASDAGVLLPAGLPGDEYTIINNCALRFIVYPPSGAAINSNTATSGGVTVAKYTVNKFYFIDATHVIGTESPEA